MAKYLAKYFLAALIIISACHPGPARAQDAPAPFDADLQRLAEVLVRCITYAVFAAPMKVPNGATKCKR